MLSTFFSAPFRVLGTTLQLAVAPHKKLQGGHFEKTQEGLIKVPKELTIREKRKYELMIKVF